MVVLVFAPLGVCSRMLAAYVSALHPGVYSKEVLKVAGIAGMAVSLIVAGSFLAFFFITFHSDWYRNDWKRVPVKRDRG